MPPEYTIREGDGRKVPNRVYITPNETGSYKVRPINKPTDPESTIDQTIESEAQGVIVKVRGTIGRGVWMGLSASFEPEDSWRRISTGVRGESLHINLGMTAAELKKDIKERKQTLGE